jgi:branched-subunit amino acid aminotransferase/4-amino-4-deoxychorismate lyase
MPITSTPKIWMNGELVDWDKAQVHVLTHTLHYGTGVFEGIRAYETDQGPAVFRLTEHIERLFSSAQIMGMEIPYTVDELVAATKETVADPLPTTATARWGSTPCPALLTCRSRVGHGVPTSATTPSRRACG